MILRRRALRTVCALLVAFGVAGPVLAGAPFQTDDPAVVAPRHTEWLVFYQQTLAATARSGALPAFELHYGALESVELDFVAPIAFDTPAGGNTRRGYGDTGLGLKYQLLEETDTTPLVGFAPRLSLPTGNADRGLGNGGAALFLPLWMLKRQGNFQAYGGGGYWLNRGTNNRDYAFLGAQAQYQVSEHWVLGAEVFHSGRQTIDQRASTGFNAGGYYLVDAHGQWLFSVGKGLQNAAQMNRMSSYLGYQWSY
jgi:outer membrane putative beta-barrel porin/alpha-amylase